MPPLSGKPNSYSSITPYAAEMLEEASAPLERFFAPYNQLLREIIGPSFGWEAKDHRKRPLSPEQKAEALAAFEKGLEQQRNRQVSRRTAEKAKPRRF